MELQWEKKGFYFDSPWIKDTCISSETAVDKPKDHNSAVRHGENITQNWNEQKGPGSELAGVTMYIYPPNTTVQYMEDKQDGD